MNPTNYRSSSCVCFERYIWSTLPPKESVRLLRPVHTFILNKNNTVFSYNAFIIVNSKFVWERICLTWTTHSLGRPTKLRLFQNSVQYFFRIEQLDFPCPKNHWRWYIIRTSIRLWRMEYFGETSILVRIFWYCKNKTIRIIMGIRSRDFYREHFRKLKTLPLIPNIHFHCHYLWCTIKTILSWTPRCTVSILELN